MCLVVHAATTSPCWAGTSSGGGGAIIYWEGGGVVPPDVKPSSRLLDTSDLDYQIVVLVDFP
jgi:hypothetical protein